MATKTLKFCHVSMQFSDTSDQHTYDADKVFSRGYDVITGTEAGPGAGNLSAALKAAGKKYGYHIQVPGRYDTWVAVKSSLIKPGSWKKGAEFALWRSSKTPEPHPGRWGDKGIVWAQFELVGYGKISVGAVHNLTNGGAGAKLKKATDIVYGKVMKKFADVHSKGALLSFIGGDFNRVDRTNDLFMGQVQYVTCWDELKSWPNTGHGNIDAIARYKGDPRVSVKSARVLDDKKLFLHTDHWLVEAEYKIKSLPFIVTPPAPVKKELLVADFSQYQGKNSVDKFKKLGAELDAMVFKLGGSNRSEHGYKFYVDPEYKSNAANARAAGVFKWIGHYYFNGKQYGKDAAKSFSDTLTGFAPGDKLIYDYEVDTKNGIELNAARALQFFDELKKLRPQGELYLYGSDYELNRLDWSPFDKLGVKRWVANYSKAPVTESWTAWQYTSSGKLKNHTGNVDLNKWKNV